MTKKDFMKSEMGKELKEWLKSQGYPTHYGEFWLWVQNDEGWYHIARKAGVNV